MKPAGFGRGNDDDCADPGNSSSGQAGGKTLIYLIGRVLKMNKKKMICLLLAAVMLFALAACGGKQEEPEPAAAEWSRQGYYEDENGNILSVTRMDDVNEPGWYVGFMNGEDPIEDSWGGMLPQEGTALRGDLPSSGSGPAIRVTVSEEGEDGLTLTVEDGETYHFSPMDLEAPVATIWVNTEGYGFFTCTEKDAEAAGDEQLTSLQYGLAEPTTYVLTALAGEEWYFVKWTLNGEDYSTDEQITVEVNEDTDLIAVFDFAGGDGQNPVMNFIGDYQSGRARAHVACIGDDGADITITWGGSAWEEARWDIIGTLDEETLTVAYSGCTKSILTYDDNGELKSEEAVYDDGTGTIVFDYEANTFTWHEDQSEYGNDMVFEWVPVTAEASVDLGSSELYTQEDLHDAVQAIEKEFASFEGCELHSIRYAGDTSCTEENLRWMNELNPDAGYTQVAEFLMDFHSPAEDGPNAWEPDTEYTDYQWWLARSASGAWEVLTWGYG